MARSQYDDLGNLLKEIHGDHLNTPRLATNQQGQKVWGWEGEACGATAPTGSVTINLRFPGQYWDAESGLHYNWNRYYDPKLCRYISSDPIGIADGLNTYAYAGNSPYRFIDPTGLAIIGEWWQEPTVQNLQVWACDKNGANCSSQGGISDLITLHFRAQGEISWSVVCTDTCKGETWFTSGSSGMVERYPISISIPAPLCKILPPGPARNACQAVAIANALANAGKFLAEAYSLARDYYSGLAAVYKTVIDPTTWCKTMPRDPGSTLK